MKKYIWAILLVLPLLLSGCFNSENVELKSVKDITYREFKDNVLKLQITLVINNPNKFKIKIKNADMDLLLNEQKIGRVTQVEQIELAGNTEKAYDLQIAVEMNEFTSNLPALFRLLMNESAQMQLSGTIQAKSFLYTKTFKVDRLSFK